MNRLRAVVFLCALVVAAFAQVPAVNATLTLSSTTAKPGAIVKGTVVVNIPAGHHAYARPATESGQVLLAVSVSPSSAIRLSKVSYPKGKNKKYPGMDANLNVYEGRVVIPVEFRMPIKTGKATFTVSVLTQICTNDTGQCYAPSTRRLTTTVTVKK